MRLFSFTYLKPVFRPGEIVRSCPVAFQFGFRIGEGISELCVYESQVLAAYKLDSACIHLIYIILGKLEVTHLRVQNAQID